MCILYTFFNSFGLKRNKFLGRLNFVEPNQLQMTIFRQTIHRCCVIQATTGLPAHIHTQT